MPPRITVRGQCNKKDLFQITIYTCGNELQLTLFLYRYYKCDRISILEFLIHYAIYLTRILNSDIYGFYDQYLKSKHCI